MVDQALDGGSPLDWLYGRLGGGIKPGLERVRSFLAAADIDPSAAPPRYLHVAGTNGKGSVCALLHALLRAHGQRAGLFTSPHLIEFRERFRIDDDDVDPAVLDRALDGMRRLVEAGDHGHGPAAGVEPTFFEITFALALRLFTDAGLPWAVLETGMGGRLDATNVVVPKVTVITPVALDHTRFLGDTLELVAAEKAGIIKPRVPVVCAPQPPPAMAVIERVARERRSPLILVDEAWPQARPLALIGEHQRFNAALAVAALRAAGIEPDPVAVDRALAGVRWPARFQRLPTHPPLVIDGAHNPHAMAQLVATWRREFPGRSATVLLGVVADKDIAPMVAALRDIAGRWVISQPPPPRGLAAVALADLVCQLTCDSPGLPSGEGSGPRIQVEPDVERAIELALRPTVGGDQPDPDPVLATGSLFFAADVLGWARRQPPSRRCSLQ